MFPKLFDLGPLTLHTYGLLLALAFLFALMLAARLAEKEGIPRNRVWDLGFTIILAAILGSKLLMVVTDPWDYLENPSTLLSLEFWQAAGVFYGGLLGAVAGSAWYISRHADLRFWSLADVAAPAIALGQSVGRLGCFSAGCCYGRPADLPWAVTFTSEYANRYVGVPLGIPLHPVQLYESVVTFLLFLGLLFAYQRRRFQGQVFFLYLFAYGMVRFFLEFYRGDLDRGFVLGRMLSISQFISLVLLPVSAAGYVYARRRGVRPGSSAAKPKSKSKAKPRTSQAS